MLQEADIIPYNLSSPPGDKKVAVLAPHPDDESLGCGGTIRLLVNANKKVKVIFLTSGDKADPSDPKSSSPPLELTHPHITAYSLMREKEAQRALGALGVSDYVFLRFPDRELLTHHEDALEALMKIVNAYAPDTLYSPSMVEPNPDHRAAAALSMEIQKSVTEGFFTAGPSGLRVVFYEVALPVRPNLLVDITRVYRRKRSAVRKYRSQLRVMDYLGHITALNTVRSLTVKGARYVEAFWSTEMPWSEEEMMKWLSYK
jgi:LmbE family N-acetylglucosaminyl deacetylase